MPEVFHREEDTVVLRWDDKDGSTFAEAAVVATQYATVYLAAVGFPLRHDEHASRPERF